MKSIRRDPARLTKTKKGGVRGDPARLTKTKKGGVRGNPTPLSESQFADLLAVFAVLVGLLVRLALPLTSAFPLNDGGLFYNMIRDLQANHYALPAFTTYNRADIPFAYPPFAFYIAGFIADLTRLDLLDVMRLLPAIVSAAAIPIFYLLAKEILPDKITAALASVLFALTPRLFDWMIMGGGITRSFGFVFAILTVFSTRKLFTASAARFVLWTSICAALTALTHPEAIPQAALAALILYVFTNRTRNGFVRLLLVAAATLALTSPWWASVLRVHGFDPFLAALSAAAGDGRNLFERIFLLFQFLFTEEPFLPLAAFFALVGVFHNLASRKFFLPAWTALPYLVEPRSGTLYMMIPLVLLAAQGLGEVILPNLEKSREPRPIFQTGAAKLFMAFIVVYLLVAGYASAYKIQTRVTLTPSQVEAMYWIRENTPPEAKFLVVTGGQPLLDPASDWFPALTGRKSLGTVFGYEWLHDGQFTKRTKRYESLQRCGSRPSVCLEAWSAETGIDFDYVYIHKTDETVILSTQMEEATDYRKTFENEGVTIFGK
jgi:hypothetical protein